MDECAPILNTGLRGIEVASTRISNVLGAEGKLIYRGFSIDELVPETSFEEVCFLLLNERMPRRDELSEFKSRLSEKRVIRDHIYSFLERLPSGTSPMDVLQAAIPMLAAPGGPLSDKSIEAAIEHALTLISGIAVITAAFERARRQEKPVVPDPDLDHAANFLYMMTGTRPDPETAKFFDTSLVLHAEHSFNASTFTARQVASTRAHIYAAVSAAIGSLSGELHGGANVRVMEMLKNIGTPDNIDTYISSVLEKGELIMGLGHAVYQTDDPRAVILEPMSRIQGEKTGQPQWHELSRTLETKAKAAFKAHKKKDIFVNVDFYSASLFYTMNIPMDLFTPVFALSRMAGWTAHVIEEQHATAAPKPLLYRPGAAYVGDYCGPENCTFTPIDKR